MKLDPKSVLCRFTWLWALNFLVLQWVFVRLVRVSDLEDGRTMDWHWLIGIVPLTGWWTPYWSLLPRSWMCARRRLLVALAPRPWVFFHDYCTHCRNCGHRWSIHSDAWGYTEGEPCGGLLDPGENYLLRRRCQCWNYEPSPVEVQP